MKNRPLVVHPVNNFDISNACNFKAVRSIGLCGDLEMMDICERSAGGRLENANLFAGCTTKSCIKLARLVETTNRCPRMSASLLSRLRDQTVRRPGPACVPAG